MIFFKNTVQGIIVGIAAIVPGVSGGVLAGVMGIYEPIISALSSFFKTPKKSVGFLLPYAVGGLVGFLLFSGIIGTLMRYAPTQTLFLFSGLVAGGFPSLIKCACKEGASVRHILYAAAAYLAMTVLTPYIAVYIDNDFLRYLAGGAVYSVGSIVPGISASFILINMGIYEELLSNLLTAHVLVPFALGFLICTAALIKLIDLVFKKYHTAAHFIVIGLLSSSIVTALPAISNPFSDIPLFAFGAVLACFFFNR